MELRGLSIPQACADLFRTAVVRFGFDTFACGELDITNKARSVFHLIDWPESWRSFYLSSGLINRDPVVEAAPHRRWD